MKHIAVGVFQNRHLWTLNDLIPIVQICWKFGLFLFCSLSLRVFSTILLVKKKIKIGTQEKEKKPWWRRVRSAAGSTMVAEGHSPGKGRDTTGLGLGKGAGGSS